LRRVFGAVGKGDVGLRQGGAQFTQRGGGDFVGASTMQIHASRDVPNASREGNRPTIANRDATIASRDATFASRDAIFASRDAIFASRDATIASRDAILPTRKCPISSEDRPFRHLHALHVLHGRKCGVKVSP
jgi:hypothetical protein